jgi:hypothetical protein
VTGRAGYPPELTISRLSEICDLSKSTVRLYISEGLITACQREGRVAIPVKDLDFLPPHGDRLIAPGQAYRRYDVTRHQLRYARVKGWVTAVRMPGGGYFRFVESEIAGRYGRRPPRVRVRP